MRRNYYGKVFFNVLLALLIIMSFSFVGNPAVYADDTGSLTVTKETTDADNAPDDEFTFKLRVWKETYSNITNPWRWGSGNRLYPGYIRLSTNEEIDWIIDGTSHNAKGLGYEPHYDQDPTTGSYNYASGYLDIYELKSDFLPGQVSNGVIPLENRGKLLASIYFDDFICVPRDGGTTFFNFINSHVTVNGYVNFKKAEIPILQGGSTNTYISDITFLDLSDIDDSFQQIGDEDDYYYTRKLKQGESFTINNIPAGYRYTVEEIDFPEDWEYKSIPNNTTGEISAGTQATVSYNNRYTAKEVVLETTWDDENNPSRPTDLTGFISIAENEAGTPEYVYNGDPAVNYNTIAEIGLEWDYESQQNYVIISNNLANYTVGNMDYNYWKDVFDDWREITEDNYGPYLFRKTDMTINRAGVEYPVYVYVSNWNSLCLVSLDDYPMPGQKLMVSGSDWTKDGNTWRATVKLPREAEVSDWGEADVPDNYEFEKGEASDNVYKMKNTLAKKDEPDPDDSDNGGNSSNNGSGNDNGAPDNGNNGSDNGGSSDQGGSNTNDSKDSTSQNLRSDNIQKSTSAKTGDDSKPAMYGFLSVLSLMLFLRLLEARRHSRM